MRSLEASPTRPRYRSSAPWPIHLATTAFALLAGAAADPAPIFGQSAESGTVAFLVQDGLRCTEQRRFSDAINALEEAWERDPSNPIVAEHLALAYLYERIPPATETLTKVRDLTRFSLEHGGQVTVFAQHLHTGLRKAVGSDHHCSGRLIVSRNGMHYRTSLTEHSFTLGLDELESVVPARNKRSSSAGELTLRAQGGKKHRIRTGTLTRFEAEIVLQLIREFLLGG